MSICVIPNACRAAVNRYGMRICVGCYKRARVKGWKICQVCHDYLETELLMVRLFQKPDMTYRTVTPEPAYLQTV